MQSSSRKNLLLLLGAGLLVGGSTALYLDRYGLQDEKLLLVLRMTARLAFVFYLIVFIARPLRQLVQTPLTAWLLRERRSFGLTMAAIHLVHMALIVYRAGYSPAFEFEFPGQIIGASIYLLMILMIVTSFERPARAVGAVNWRRLHKTGLYGLGIAFLSTLIPATPAEWQEPERRVFLLLTVIAVGIRSAAFIRMRRRRKRPA